MPHATTLLAITIATALAVALPAQEPEPARQPLSPGPLLAFTEIVDNSGPRVVAIRVAELTAPAEPAAADPSVASPSHEIYRGPDSARVATRLGRNHVLLALREPTRLVAVHVQTGQMRELVRGEVRFAGTRAGDVIFVEGSGAKARLAAVPWDKPGMPARLAEQPLNRVPRIAGNLAFAIAPDDREIWVVSLASGRSRRLWSAPDGHGRLRIALAPSGQRLAIGAVDRRNRSRGHLTVIDTATAEVLCQAEDLPIWLSPLASGAPSMEVAFAGDQHVVCSETRGDRAGIRGEFVHVTREIETSEITDESPYSGLALRHRTPVPTGPAPRFEIRRGDDPTGLYPVAAEKPVATIPKQREQYEDLAVAPGGQFATARLGERRQHLTLFAVNRPPRRLSQAWAHRLVWLPATR